MPEPRQVEARAYQEDNVELFPGGPLRGTLIRVVMVYSDNGRPADIHAGYEDLSIVGYMVKLRSQYLQSHPHYPSGGIVEDIDLRVPVVSIGGMAFTPDEFHKFYEVD